MLSQICGKLDGRKEGTLYQGTGYFLIKETEDSLFLLQRCWPAENLEGLLMKRSKGPEGGCCSEDSWMAIGTSSQL